MNLSNNHFLILINRIISILNENNILMNYMQYEFNDMEILLKNL